MRKALFSAVLFLFILLVAHISLAAPSLAPIPDDLEKAMAFHGHICNGFAKGYIASKVAMKELQGEGFQGAQILPIAENNQCGLDSIQMTLTENSAFGNTVGNRERGLVIDDVGKDAFRFLRLTDMKGIRVVIKPEIVEKIFKKEAWEYNVLRRKYFLGIAREREKEKFMAVERESFKRLLALSLEDICRVRALTGEEISEIEDKYLSKLGPPDNKKLICPVCKEQFLASRAMKLGGKRICITCFNKNHR